MCAGQELRCASWRACLWEPFLSNHVRKHPERFTPGCAEPPQRPQPIPRPASGTPAGSGPHREDFPQLSLPCGEACAFTSRVCPCPGQVRMVGLPRWRPLSPPSLYKAARHRVTHMTSLLGTPQPSHSDVFRTLPDKPKELRNIKGLESNRAGGNASLCDSTAKSWDSKPISSGSAA